MRAFRLLPLLSGLLMALPGLATHNRAGEIIICHVGGLTYRVTIITHTKLSAPADRPELVLDWGDGSPLDTIARTSIIDDTTRDLRRNEYVELHTYPGPGEFVLQFDDQNRNGGVVNVPNSIAQSFCVKTKLLISPVTGNNCSVRFANSPIQDACLGQPWIHNPAAFDLDGDSLSYEPVVCLGLGCNPIGGYTYPSAWPQGGGNTYGIDPVTGTISWLVPGLLGEYNIAFIVREWRRGVNGQMYNVGWVMRDMQITVKHCENQPPVVSDPPDLCVVAGTFVSFPVQANDPDPGQTVTLTALGQPFQVPSSPAVFSNPAPAPSVTGIFNWQTNCSHVRQVPYQVVFNATDNGQPVALQNYSVMNITVVGPPPLNPLASPSGSAIQLNWSPPANCPQVNGYRIYRRNGLYGFTPGPCETDVPAYTGYVHIATVSGLNNTSYLDDDNLTIGSQYCYMVVATFANGARSIASVEFCAILDRQVPVIVKVSVGVTDAANGVDTIRWSNAYDLDTNARPGPYQFKLYRGTAFTTATQLIHTSPLHPFLAHPDTTFIDPGIDTRNSAHVYRVELLGNGGTDLIGSSSVASSVFISTVPNDEQLTVQWALNTPWANTLYEVFRWDGGQWVLIGTSTGGSYTDTGLVNGQLYCYLVRSTGAYADPDIVAPLVNFSQEVCGVPVDLTPPCAPVVMLENDCQVPLNLLSWTNPANACGDADTHAYNIYFADPVDGVYVLVGTNTGAGDTLFAHINGNSVAGCYVVTAIDSLGNESPFGTPVCGDNCPRYELPNVFTPNGDGSNDLFGPLLPYRGVRRIDLQVFNRWGQPVFGSQDPAIDWPGTYKDTGELLPDGVYYYVCDVVFARLGGDQAVTLKGYVHLLGGTGRKHVD